MEKSAERIVTKIQEGCKRLAKENAWRDALKKKEVAIAKADALAKGIPYRDLSDPNSIFDGNLPTPEEISESVKQNVGR